MPHPANACVIAAQLLRRVWAVSFAREPLDIEAEHRRENWQEAWNNYQGHIRGCGVCLTALAAMDVVGNGTVIISAEAMR